METAVIGDTAAQPGRDSWLRRAVLIAAVLFVILLSYLLIAALVSGDDDGVTPGADDAGDELGTASATVGDIAPGDRPAAVVGLGVDPNDHIDVSCRLPTAFTPMVVELVNAGPATTTVGVHVEIQDRSGQVYPAVATADELRPGEQREVLPRVKAERAVTLVGGVARCDIVALQLDRRTVILEPMTATGP